MKKKKIEQDDFHVKKCQYFFISNSDSIVNAI